MHRHHTTPRLPALLAVLAAACSSAPQHTSAPTTTASAPSVDEAGATPEATTPEESKQLATCIPKGFHEFELNVRREGRVLTLCASSHKATCWTLDLDSERYDTVPWVEPAPNPVRVERREKRWSVCDAGGCVEVVPPTLNSCDSSGHEIVAFNDRRDRLAIASDTVCDGGNVDLKLYEVPSGRLLMRQIIADDETPCVGDLGFIGERLWMERNVCAGPGGTTYIYDLKPWRLVAATYTRERDQYASPTPPGVALLKEGEEINTYGAPPVRISKERVVLWDSSGGALQRYHGATNTWDAYVDLSVLERDPDTGDGVWGGYGPGSAALVELGAGQVAVVLGYPLGEVAVVDMLKGEVVQRVQPPTCPE